MDNQAYCNAVTRVVVVLLCTGTFAYDQSYCVANVYLNHINAWSAFSKRKDDLFWKIEFRSPWSSLPDMNTFLEGTLRGTNCVPSSTGIKGRSPLTKKIKPQLRSWGWSTRSWLWRTSRVEKAHLGKTFFAEQRGSACTILLLECAPSSLGIVLSKPFSRRHALFTWPSWGRNLVVYVDLKRWMTLRLHNQAAAPNKWTLVRYFRLLRNDISSNLTIILVLLNKTFIHLAVMGKLSEYHCDFQALTIRVQCLEKENACTRSAQGARNMEHGARDMEEIM